MKKEITMSPQKTLRIFIPTFLTFLCLTFVSSAFTQDCQDCPNSVPTPAGNVSYPEGWGCECTGATPTIVATYSEEMDTIDSEKPVILSVDPNSLSCPPYTWSTESTGYSLTDNHNGTVTLSVVSGTCIKNGVGNYDIYATVTVTDNCDPAESSSIVIRHSAGEWKLIKTGGNGANSYYICGEGDGSCDHGTIEYIDGHEKWEVVFSSGTYSCIRNQRVTGIPGSYNKWTTLSEDEYPPCGGSWDCSKEQGSCGYHEGEHLYCYCKARYCYYYKWSCP
jgi:hypothetical protein